MRASNESYKKHTVRSHLILAQKNTCIFENICIQITEYFNVLLPLCPASTTTSAAHGCIFQMIHRYIRPLTYDTTNIISGVNVEGIMVIDSSS